MSFATCKVSDFSQIEFSWEYNNIRKVWHCEECFGFNLCKKNNSAKKNPPELHEDNYRDDSLQYIDPIILGEEECFIGFAAVFDEEGSTKVAVPTFSSEAISDVPA